MNNKILKTLGATALLSSFAGTAAADVVIAETETTKNIDVRYFRCWFTVPV